MNHDRVFLSFELINYAVFKEGQSRETSLASMALVTSKAFTVLWELRNLTSVKRLCQSESLLMHKYFPQFSVNYAGMKVVNSDGF